MDGHIDKCECHIHSLGGGLAEATIIKQVGDNKYHAEYNGVTCTAIFNPFVKIYKMRPAIALQRFHAHAGFCRPVLSKIP